MKIPFLFKTAVTSFTLLILCHEVKAQHTTTKTYSHADTLRGSLTPERSWWDVQRYDISVKPDYTAKTIEGKNSITYLVTANPGHKRMQIDLKAPLSIDSILLNGSKKINFTQDGNAWLLDLPDQKKASIQKIEIFYHGKVHEAIRAPWDGGWIFTKDAQGRPWMTVACQGAAGASIWYPCKDHQSDEPDKGASLTMTVPDSLTAVANGRLASKKNNGNGTTSYKWVVVNPINNYCLIPYIGKYVNFTEVYPGAKGKLDLSYWVLDYNLQKARSYMPAEVKYMLKSFEYWMGPYPFYEDGYKLIDAPHSGMEHQSAVAYGNKYQPGYGGRDASGTGWGMKWDFIIVHESGHEWFGNNITTKDLADMWVHEGFTNYSETLYTEYRFGKEAGNAYNYGIRKGIRNDQPIIPAYNVNAQGSGDMYPKGANMIHTIRHSIDNDLLFRNMIRGLNKTFYHQTVTSKEIENYLSKQAGYDYSKVYDQYLRTTQIPELELRFNLAKNEVAYRWRDCVKGFNLPLVLKQKELRVKLFPSEQFQTRTLKAGEASLFEKGNIEKAYYVSVITEQI
ncbi:M1 family metallopeptidase [Pedobacter nutrimenti]|uniref:M1 family metallopeptidase n=1 Tax=Pedobacter nutrimenti TaxID=1241337 RepID=UPI00292F196A|nr:M1 family metallopeptidase [Pedobacter nutrimenti]